MFSVHSHMLALIFGSFDADLLTWGWGKDGQLGHGDRRSEKLAAVCEFLHGRDLLQVCCGGWHTTAVTSEGEVFTWGSGRCGQLGHGDWASHRLPCVVAALQGKPMLQVRPCVDWFDGKTNCEFLVLGFESAKR